MSALGSVGLGVASALVAAFVFLAALRILLTPKILISRQLVHRINRRGEEVYRIKIVNARRWSEAVKVTLELVTLMPVAVPEVTIKGHRRLLIFKRRTVVLEAYKRERETLPLRPSEMVSIPRGNRNDRNPSYAFRVTTPACDRVRQALEHENETVRFRVYAEHPWSGRGKVFERVFSTEQAVVDGDFPVGPGLKAEPDGPQVNRRRPSTRARRKTPPPVIPESEPEHPTG
jgi:hypothetical protein